MWTNRISAIHRDRCREFSGRLEAGAGNKAELYQHMKEDGSTTSTSLVQCQFSTLRSSVFTLTVAGRRGKVLSLRGT